MAVASQESSASARIPGEVWALVVANFFVAIGFGIVAPALPTFASSFGVGVFASAVVISAFAFMRLVFAPASGRLVNLLAERPVYLTGLLIVAASSVASALAANYTQLLIFRGLGGIGSTMFTVSGIGLLVRLSPPEVRGKASSMWASGFLLGNITGPLVGGGLIVISLRAPFFTYAGTLLVAAAVGAVFLRRSGTGHRERAAEPAMTFMAAARSRSYRAVLGSNFANGWIDFGARVSLVPLFVTQVLDEPDQLAGFALAAFAAANAVMLQVSGRLADRVGRKPPLMAGLLVISLGSVWLGTTGGRVEFLVASVVVGLGAGLLNPPQQAVVADVVGSGRRGGPALAGFQMASDVGAIAAPVAAGALAQAFSFSVAFGVTGAIGILALGYWVRAGETLPRGGYAASAPVGERRNSSR